MSKILLVLKDRGSLKEDHGIAKSDMTERLNNTSTSGRSQGTWWEEGPGLMLAGSVVYSLNFMFLTSGASSQLSDSKSA